MNTCDTCKHWHWWKGFEERDDMFPFKPCAHPKLGDPVEDNPEDGAGVFSSIDSSFVTYPKFGCIHHQPK